jgi:uncharacterized phage-associated protein
MSVAFPYDQERATQAVLWLLAQHGGKLPVLKLMKLVFFADRLHLARYGRPIVGGRYVAMPYGPVASELKDDVDEPKPPRPAFEREGNDVKALGAYDEDVLSDSDLEVLAETNAKYGRLDTFRLRDLTHELEAWRKNYKEGAEKRSFPLPYEDFFADLDDEARQMLAIIEEDCEARTALK